MAEHIQKTIGNLGPKQNANLMFSAFFWKMYNNWRRPITRVFLFYDGNCDGDGDYSSEYDEYIGEILVIITVVSKKVDINY